MCHQRPTDACKTDYFDILSDTDSDTHATVYNLHSGHVSFHRLEGFIPGGGRPVAPCVGCNSYMSVSEELYGIAASHESFILCQVSGEPLPLAVMSDESQQHNDMTVTLAGNMAGSDIVSCVTDSGK